MYSIFDNGLGRQLPCIGRIGSPSPLATRQHDEKRIIPINGAIVIQTAGNLYHSTQQLLAESLQIHMLKMILLSPNFTPDLL